MSGPVRRYVVVIDPPWGLRYEKRFETREMALVYMRSLVRLYELDTQRGAREVRLLGEVS